jgi:hypothetical protein
LYAVARRAMAEAVTRHLATCTGGLGPSGRFARTDGLHFALRALPFDKYSGRFSDKPLDAQYPNAAIEWL